MKVVEAIQKHIYNVAGKIQNPNNKVSLICRIHHSNCYLKKKVIYTSTLEEDMYKIDRNVNNKY